MTKQEFEKLIGKRIDDDTYDSLNTASMECLSKAMESGMRPLEGTLGRFR